MYFTPKVFFFFESLIRYFFFVYPKNISNLKGNWVSRVEWVGRFDQLLPFRHSISLLESSQWKWVGIHRELPRGRAMTEMTSDKVIPFFHTQSHIGRKEWERGRRGKKTHFGSPFLHLASHFRHFIGHIYPNQQLFLYKPLLFLPFFHYKSIVKRQISG